MSNFALPALSAEMGLSEYMEKVSAFPYLTQEEEEDLAKRWYFQGDVEAAHKLVTSHLRLVAKIAMGFKGYGLPAMEVISEGNIGLMQAVKKFDPDKGFRLSTYAMWWIKASIQEYILKSWSLVKIGTTAAQKKLFFNLRKVKNRMEKFDNNSLTDEEVRAISDELDVSERDVVEMNGRLLYSDQSLNVPVIASEDSSDEMIDFIQEDSDYEKAIEEQDDLRYKRELFIEAMGGLNDREKYIISARRLREEPETLEELSQRYGISRERVRQIENRAFEKLQQQVASKVLN